MSIRYEIDSQSIARITDPLQRQLLQEAELNFRRNGSREILRKLAMLHKQRKQKTASSVKSTEDLKYARPQTPFWSAVWAAVWEAYDDFPIDLDDLSAIDRDDDDVPTLESACHQGSLSKVQSIVSTIPARTPFFLQAGLATALRTGKVDIASYLLAEGATILGETPKYVFSAPQDQQLPLFEVLVSYGWTVNTPGFRGEVLLPTVVSNPLMLRWFLDHGADPNLAEQRYYSDVTGGPDADHCAALEIAAEEGNVEAARLLLENGAKLEYGYPLQIAAGVCQEGTNPYFPDVTPTEDFDRSRIPVMSLLVEQGADVNQELKSRHMVATHAVTRAVLAGAVERVRWLLEHGADPELKGPYGSVVSYARSMRGEEMKQVINQWMRANNKMMDQG